MGGRLLNYSRQWLRIQPGSWLREVVSKGYLIEFTSPPPRHSQKVVTSLPRDPVKRAALLTEVAELQRKQAIVAIDPSVQGFFLVQAVSGAQEVGRMAAHHQSETVERSHQANAFQDGDPRRCSPLPNQGHLGNESGSQGRLPACPHSPERPAMAEVSGGGQRLSVPMPSLWPVHGTTGLHSSGPCSSIISEAPGSQSMRVPGRLDDLRSVQGVGHSTHQVGCRYGHQVGVHYQHEEVYPRPHAVSQVPRCAAQPCSRSSGADTRPCGQPHQLCQPAISADRGRSSSVVTSVGTDGELCGPHPSVQVPHATQSDPPIGVLSTLSTRGRSHGSGNTPYQAGPAVVDAQVPLAGGGGVPDPSSRLRGHHGRVGVGMGGTWPASGPRANGFRAKLRCISTSWSCGQYIVLS